MLGPISEAETTARTDLARHMYDMLASIPLDDLAANGESIRGKLTRIVVALLRIPDMGLDWISTIQDWWTLVSSATTDPLTDAQFSQINFVQLIPQNLSSVLESRMPSPEPRDVAGPV